MANINFRLNKGKRIESINTPQTIYLRYKLGREIDFNASIGFKVISDNWDSEKQQVKNRSHILNRNEINNLIKNLRNHFEDFEKSNREKGFIPNYSDVKKYYDTFYTHSDTDSKKEYNLFSFIDEFIEKAKTIPNATTKKLVTKNTLKDYVLTRNTLKNFNDEVYKINFDSITIDWHSDFVNWCNLKGFKMNYTGKHIKTLKTFLNNALELGVTNNIEFKRKAFNVFKEDTDNIYLNLDELQQMWDLDLSKEPKKDNVRDLFLIGAFTGLRVSDFNNINPNKIKVVDGVKMIIVRTQKTKINVPVIFHPITEAIFQKYNNCPPPKMNEQVINKLIKEIGKELNFNDKVELNFNSGGKDVSVYRHKYELIVSHTARRSFCTNAYLSGMDSMDIMSISGHTSEKNFKKYIKVTAEEVAIKMSKHSFYTNGTALKKV
jgi:site-specific recombinase XerD